MNVVGTVVIEASERVGDNQWILELAKTDPAIVGFVGHLVPGQPEFAGNLRRWLPIPSYAVSGCAAAISRASPNPLSPQI